MAERVGAQAGAAEMLRAYIEALVGFVRTHRSLMKALVEIVLGGGLAYGAVADRAALSPLGGFLRRGQDEGVFRAFDPVVMAAVVQRALDWLPLLLESVPGLDCEHYAQELVTLVDIGTRSRS